MPCKSCVDKLEARLLKNHPSIAKAEAHKLAVDGITRYEEHLRQRCQQCAKCKRRRKDWHNIRLFGVPIMLVSRTNPLASFVWTLKKRRLVWIGKGYNPDYTQACTIVGTCTCLTGAQGCLANLDCVPSPTGCSCGCPAPTDPHSHLVSNCSGSSSTTNNCSCNTRTGVCASGKTCVCGGCSGTCGYSCDSGYAWNGSQCVATSVEKIVTDSISQSEVPLVNKIIGVADNISESEAVKKNCASLIVSDTITITDIPLANKSVIVPDAIHASDAPFINKTVYLSDAIMLAEVIKRDKPSVTVTDSVSLSESILTDKMVVLSDSMTLADVAKVDKTLLVGDAVMLVETALANKSISIADAISLAETIVVLTGGVTSQKIYFRIGNVLLDLSTSHVEYADDCLRIGDNLLIDLKNSKIKVILE